MTKSPNRPGRSSAFLQSRDLVTIAGIVVNCAEQLSNPQLISPAHVLVEGGAHGFSLCLVAANAAGLFDQLVVQRKIGWHRGAPKDTLHIAMCGYKRKNDLLALRHQSPRLAMMSRAL